MPKRSISDPLHEGQFRHKISTVRKCKSKNDRLFAQPHPRVLSRRQAALVSFVENSKPASCMSLSLPLKSTKITTTGGFDDFTKNSTLDKNPYQLQQESPLPTKSKLVVDESAYISRASPVSSKKRARECVCLAELDIRAYPGYITYFGHDGNPTNTYQLDIPWNNSNYLTNSCPNSNTVSKKKTNQDDSKSSSPFCNIFFDSIDECPSVYDSSLQVRSSSTHLCNHTKGTILVSESCKHRRVSRKSSLMNSSSDKFICTAKNSWSGSARSKV